LLFGSIASMNDYKATIGLEIHRGVGDQDQDVLARASTMPMRSAPTSTSARSAWRHPGTAAVINRDAVKKVLLSVRHLARPWPTTPSSTARTTFTQIFPKATK